MDCLLLTATTKNTAGRIIIYQYSLLCKIHTRRNSIQEPLPWTELDSSKGTQTLLPPPGIPPRLLNTTSKVTNKSILPKKISVFLILNKQKVLSFKILSNTNISEHHQAQNNHQSLRQILTRITLFHSSILVNTPQEEFTFKLISTFIILNCECTDRNLVEYEFTKYA